MEKEELLDFYQKYKIIIFPVLVGLVGLILILLVIYPQVSKLIENNASYRKMVHKSEFLEVKAQELEGLDENDLKNKVRISLAALPDGQDFADVISILQRQTGQSGFILSTLKFAPGSQTATGRSQFSVRMEVGGPKDSFNTLLTNIESSYRPMRISSFEVNGSDSGETLTSIITINVFYAPLPQNLGSVDSALPKLTEKDQELIDLLARSTSAGESGSLQFTPKGKSDPFE